MNAVERMRQIAIESDPDSCWPWPLMLDACGYGVVRVKIDDRWFCRKAHRVAFAVLAREIPGGMDLDHLCRNRACINPRHLEPVSERENVLRSDAPAARQARRTHCIRGHPFDGENLRVHVGANGRLKRDCKVCEKIRYALSRLRSAS